MQNPEERVTATGIAGIVVGGAALTALIATLLATRPAQAAPTDEKLDYLIDVLTALVPLLAEVAEGQTELVAAMQQWLAAQGIAPVEGVVEVSVKTQWVAQEPEQIFSSAIRSAGAFNTDRMVNWTKGKRIMFKAESSLNQAVTLQVIGNIVDDRARATDINGALPLAANGNLSVGLAWDDWHPFVGIEIVAAIAPTAGILTILSVIQE